MAETSKALTRKGGFVVNVVTPTGLIANQDTDAVIAPGRLGEFEVLPGHIPFLTELHPGVLTIGERGPRAIFAVSVGFVEVSPGGDVQVLVERAVPAGDIDVEAAKAELDESTLELKEWKGEPDSEYDKVRTRQAWAQAQLDAHRISAN